MQDFFSNLPNSQLDKTVRYEETATGLWFYMLVTLCGVRFVHCALKFSKNIGGFFAKTGKNLP